MSERPFYVYELTDPRYGSVFYVGKGRGGRIGAHENEARRGITGRKCDLIRSIWADGFKVERRVIGTFKREIDAVDREAERIAELGLHNLTNIMARGNCSDIAANPIHKVAELVIAVRKWHMMGMPTTLHVPGGSLDLAAIAKGWICDLYRHAETLGFDRVRDMAARKGIKMEVPIRENG